MQKWEYISCARYAGQWTDDKFDGRTVQEKLSDFGKEGWELVSVVYDSSGYNYYLKRPLATRRTSTKKAKSTSTTKSTKK